MSKGGVEWLIRAPLLLVVIGIAVVCVSLSQGCANNECQDALDTLSDNLGTYNANRSGLWLGPASTMEELVDESDVIVVGAVECAVGVAHQAPYQADKTCKGEFDVPPPHPAHPHVDFLIDVERVILDDGTISGGKPLLIRVGGRWQSKSFHPGFERMPAPGDRRLFALAREPNVQIHTLDNLWNQFLIDGEKITYSDILRTPACLAGKVKPGDFIQALEDATGAKSET